MTGTHSNFCSSHRLRVFRILFSIEDQRQKVLFHDRCNNSADQPTNAYAPELSLERSLAMMSCGRRNSVICSCSLYSITTAKCAKHASFAASWSDPESCSCVGCNSALVSLPIRCPGCKRVNTSEKLRRSGPESPPVSLTRSTSY